MIIAVVGSRGWGGYSNGKYTNKYQVSVFKVYMNLIKDEMLFRTRPLSIVSCWKLPMFWCNHNNTPFNSQVVCHEIENSCNIMIAFTENGEYIDSMNKTVKLGKKCMVIDEKGEWKWYSPS